MSFFSWCLKYRDIEIQGFAIKLICFVDNILHRGFKINDIVFDTPMQVASRHSDDPEQNNQLKS